MADINPIFTAIVGAEGATLDLTASDRGNWTGGAVGVGRLVGSKFGVSAAAYPTLDIASLSRAGALAIFRHDVWDCICGDTQPQPVAAIVADEAWNQGLGAAGRDLQAALEVHVDGVIGPATMAAVARHANDLSGLVMEIAARRAVRYALTSTVASFGLGWFRRLMGVVHTAIA